jgi:hypothetical protein
VWHSPEDDANHRFVALDSASFVGPGGLIEFLVSETGRVTGLTRGRFYPFQRES